MRVFIPLLCMPLLCIICWQYPAYCAQVYQAGFRTLGAWSEEPPLRVDVSIWYPANRQPRELNYPPWTISAALNARPAEGKFPLLVISHATPADRYAYHELAAWLAREGFVVAAPGHGNDCMNNMDDLFTFEQLARRAREMASAIDMTLAEKDLARIIDASRIGVAGFGSGAAAALLLGGALPDCAGWPEYCKRAGASDVYCSPWARERINGLCMSFPLQKSLADPRVKAIAAIAPGYGMLFDAESFRHFYPPLLLVAAGRDKFNRVSLHCEPLARLLGSRARFLDLPNADEGALMSPCPPALANELPELCKSVSPSDRQAILQKLENALLAFFGHYLLITGNLPNIPAPPDLAPPAPEPPAPSQPARKRRAAH